MNEKEYKLKYFCNDGGNKKYLEDGVELFKNYDKALLACYDIALDEVEDLMIESDENNWYEVCRNFEITEAYQCDALAGVSYFPVATVWYDKAPWDRKNDCDIKIVTGYIIVEAEE